ncbi:NAD-P-binding protein [Hysterangium stoloniferum]|nr:NAD-P-binding protein [Hysterangium stoloniferum]
MTTTHEYRLTSTTGSKGLQLQQANVPGPRGNEVLVKIHAVSLQFRDLIMSTGQYPGSVKDNVVPGSDAAGEIIKVGADVKGWKKGDRVCANFCTDHIAGDATAEITHTALGGLVDGVLTQYRTFPAHCLVHIPEHLSYEEASTLPCAAVTAYNALMGPVKIKAGDYVLVQGTGGVSIFALQFAVFSGAIVIATSSSDEKLQIAKKLGAKHLINYNKVPKWDEEVMKITQGRGVDHIIEVGGPGTMAKSLRSVRFGGWIHTIGFVASDKEEVDVAMACLMRGSYLRGILVGPRHSFEDMNRLIIAAQLRPVIDKVFRFEKTHEAYEYLTSQKHVGKVVIKVADN